MNFKQNDIIIRNTGDTPTVWLSQRLVMDVCGFSDDYIRLNRFNYKNSVQKCYHHHNILPDTGKGWRWAKMDAGFYYDLSRIPNRAPQFYRELFGDAAELVKNYNDFLNGTQTTDFENLFKRHLNQVYRSYLEFYNDANEVQRPALAKACAVIDFILEFKDDYQGTKNKIYKDLETVLKKLDLQYIPHHHLRLKEKIDELFETESLAIPDVIKLPRTGNNHASVHTDPVVYGWAMQLRASDANFTDAHIIRTIWDACDRTGRKKPSRRWFGQNIFEKPETRFLTSKRYGSGKKGNVSKSYMPIEDALYAGDCWEIDATRVNIIAHQAVDNDGKKIEKHLMMVAVRDVMSGDVVGYSFTYAEDAQSYSNALKMAVQTTGYLPYEIVTDRFPGHNSEKFQKVIERIENLGTKFTIGYKANQKARLERWFGTFQSVIMIGSKYYYGEGITSTRNTAHRSPEYIARIKKESKKAGFDMIEAVKEAETLVEKYRNTRYSYYSRKHANLHKTPIELHNESEKPLVNYINNRTVSMLFENQTGITIRNNGQFIIEVDGVKHYYQIPIENYNAISKTNGRKVLVTYSYEDFSEVYLWEENGNLLVYISEALEINKVTIYGPKQELGKLSQQKARERQIEFLKAQQLESISLQANEESMLMGINTNKIEANYYEDEYLNNAAIPIKKVSGSDVLPDNESGIFDDFRSEY